MAIRKIRQDTSTGAIWPILPMVLYQATAQEDQERSAAYNGEIIIGSGPCMNAWPETYCRTLLVGSGSLVNPNFICSLNNTSETATFGLNILLNTITDQPKTFENASPPAARPADLLTSVKNNLNLNVSQLARVFDVGRPTIYKWLSGTFPRHESWQKISEIAVIARNYRLPHTRQCSRFLDSPGEHGEQSLIDALGAAKLDQDYVEKRLSSILGALEAGRKESIATRLKKRGFGELSDKGRRESLAPFVRNARDEMDD